MHIVINSDCFIIVCIVPFWDKLKIWRKFWVAKERFHTLDDITEIDIEDFTTDHYFLTFESWATGQLRIDHLIQLSGVLVREAEFLANLIYWIVVSSCGE